MGGSSPSSTTSTQKQQPPDYVLPYLQNAASSSQDLYNEGPKQYYSGNTVTPFSSQTQQALDLTQQRATDGSPVTDAAQNYAANTLNGAPTSDLSTQQNPWAFGSNSYGSSSNPYASSPNPFGGASNPYLDQTFQNAALNSQNVLSSEFARSGRNVDASAPARAGMLADLASNIYAPAYENDRNRQLQYQQQLTGIGATGYEDAQNRQLQYQQQLTGIGAQGYEDAQNRGLQDISQQRSLQANAAGLAPSLAAQDYADLGALQGVGQQYEDLNSRNIADQVARYDYAQNAPGINLDQYIARLNNQPGGSSSATTPYFTNRAAGGLGGATVGYGLGNSLNSQYGGGIGAALGGLLGAYG